ncbi:hypothetical protein F2Q70_00038992 [Brassica cretica]|uniref:Uncharacterized protein n=1 Tax=Brassica cretica TaxID=69181 RepID=A0A8S9KB98_BRACR|nr:hypothetical protein F2Q70_00038992 [Brassica cretica]
MHNAVSSRCSSRAARHRRLDLFLSSSLLHRSIVGGPQLKDLKFWCWNNFAFKLAEKL